MSAPGASLITKRSVPAACRVARSWDERPGVLALLEGAGLARMLADASSAQLDRLGAMVGLVALLEDHAVRLTASAMRGSLTLL